MRSVAWSLVFTMVAFASPARAEVTDATTPAETSAASADPTLGDAVPGAALDAALVIASASQAVDDEDDDNPAFLLLIGFLALNLFVTIDQSTTAEHP